jgi:hypothetical protein
MNSAPYRKGPLVAAALSRSVDDDRRQEDDRGVEVQHRRHDCLEAEQRREQHDRPAADPLDARAERGEHAVRLDDGADEEQARDEDERRPRLPGGLEHRVGHRRRRTRAAARYAWVSVAAGRSPSRRPRP